MLISMLILNPLPFRHKHLIAKPMDIAAHVFRLNDQELPKTTTRTSCYLNEQEFYFYSYPLSP